MTRVCPSVVLDFKTLRAFHVARRVSRQLEVGDTASFSFWGKDAALHVERLAQRRYRIVYYNDPAVTLAGVSLADAREYADYLLPRRACSPKRVVVRGPEFGLHRTELVCGTRNRLDRGTTPTRRAVR